MMMMPFDTSLYTTSHDPQGLSTGSSLSIFLLQLWPYPETGMAGMAVPIHVLRGRWADAHPHPSARCLPRQSADGTPQRRVAARRGS
jgi:hypothetical protein